MANIEYDLNKDLSTALAEMQANVEFTEFNELRENEIIVLACVRIRMDDDGETQPCKGDVVMLKKVTPLEKLFITKKPHYFMVVDHHAWTNAHETARAAMLHRGLMRIAVEKGETGIKLGMRKPDIAEFTATVRRFGAFSDVLCDLRDAFRSSAHRLVPAVDNNEESR